MTSSGSSEPPSLEFLAGRYLRPASAYASHDILTATRGRPANLHLAVGAEQIAAEQQAALQQLLDGFASIVLQRKLTQGLRFWARKFFQYHKLYKLTMTVDQHMALVNWAWGMCFTPDVDFEPQYRLFDILQKLLRSPELLPQRDMALPWRDIYTVLTEVHHAKMRTSISVPRNHGKELVTLTFIARRYFGSHSTTEILQEIRPKLCPHDEAIFGAAACLYLLLPTDPDSAAGQSPDFLCWIEEMMDVWTLIPHSREWDKMFLSLFARTCRYNYDMVDLKQHYPYIFSKILNTFNLPLGSGRVFAPPQYEPSAFTAMVSQTGASTSIAVGTLIIHLITPENQEVQRYLDTLFATLETFVHPSNVGPWISGIAGFVSFLCAEMCRRCHRESRAECRIASSSRIRPEDRVAFARRMLPFAHALQLSKIPQIIYSGTMAMNHLAYLAPGLVLPPLIERIAPALETLTETHQTTAALGALGMCARQLLHPDMFEEGALHLLNILPLTVPGIDINDSIKTSTTLHLYAEVLSHLVLVDCSAAARPAEVTDSEDLLLSATSSLEGWALEVVQRLLDILQTQVAASSRGHNVESGVLARVQIAALSLFEQMSPSLARTATDQLVRFVQSTLALENAKSVAMMCYGAVQADPEYGLSQLVPYLTSTILELASNHDLAVTAPNSVDKVDDKLLWCLAILARTVKMCGPALLPHRQVLIDVLDATLPLASKKAVKLAGKLLRHVLIALLTTYLTEYRSVPPSVWRLVETDPMAVFRYRGVACRMDRTGTDDPDDIVSTFPELEPQWHVPTAEEVAFADELLSRFCTPALQELTAIAQESAPGASDKAALVSVRLRNALVVIRNVTRVGPDVMSECDLPPLSTHDDDNPTVPQPLLTHLGPKPQAAATLRREISEQLHRVFQWMLKDNPNDVRNMKTCIKIARLLLCSRGITEDKVGRAAGGYHMMKSIGQDLVTGRKIHARRKLLCRVALQVDRRTLFNRHTIPYHALHRDLIEDLLEYSLVAFPTIRQTAQAALSNALAMIPLAKRDIIPKIMDVLTDEKCKRSAEGTGAQLDFTSAMDTTADAATGQLAASSDGDINKAISAAASQGASSAARGSVRPLAGPSDDRLKGALYLLHHNVIAKSIARRWDWSERLVLDLATLESHDKLSIQARVYDVFKTMSNHVLAHYIDMEWTDAHFDRALALAPRLLEGKREEYHGARAIAAADRQQRELAKLHGYVRSLCNLLMSQSQHWRYELMIADKIEFLIYMQHAILPEMGEYFTWALVSDTLDMRQSAHKAVRHLLERTKYAAKRVPVLMGGEVANPVIVTGEPPRDRYGRLSHNMATCGQGTPAVPAGIRADNIYATFRLKAEDRPKPEDHDQLIFFDKNFMGWNGWAKSLTAYAPMQDQPPRPSVGVVAPTLRRRRSIPPTPNSTLAADSPTVVSSEVAQQAVTDAMKDTAKESAKERLADPSVVRRHLDACNAAMFSVLQQPEFLQQYFEYACQETVTGSTAASGETEETPEYSSHNCDLWKGVFRNFGPAALQPLKPHIEAACANQTRIEAQITAAEILAGLVRGIKFWRGEEIQEVWAWLIPLLDKTLAQVTHESAEVWASFGGSAAYDRDPRRQYPLFDWLLSTPLAAGGELSTLVQWSRLYIAGFSLSELSWRGQELALAMFERFSTALDLPYRLLRDGVALILMAALRHCWVGNMKNQQHPALDTTGMAAAEQFLARAMAPLDVVLDVQALQALSPEQRDALVNRAKTLLLTVQHTYTQIGGRVLMSSLPKLVERFLVLPELKEDDELTGLCNLTLNLLANNQLPVADAQSLFAVLLQCCRTGSWHSKSRALRMLQILLLRNLFYAPHSEMLDVLSTLMGDQQLEVRILAGQTLSGTIQCGVSRDLAAIQKRFQAMLAGPRKIKSSKAAGSGSAAARDKDGDRALLLRRHAGVLGLQAMLLAFPYDMPDWMPSVLLAIGECANDPEPIRTTVKKALSEFWRTHQDQWSIFKHKLTEDERLFLTDLLISPSYYA